MNSQQQFGYKILKAYLFQMSKRVSGCIGRIASRYADHRGQSLNVSNVAEFDKAFQASRESKKLLLLVRDRQFIRYISFPIE
jgi:hypothetical protein